MVFFFQAEDGIRDIGVTGVQTCALPISEQPEERFTFHSSRMRMMNVTPEELRAMNAQMDRCAAELADARCDVVTTACLVAIMAQGAGFHCTAEDQISEVLQEEGDRKSVV